MLKDTTIKNSRDKAKTRAFTESSKRSKYSRALKTFDIKPNAANAESLKTAKDRLEKVEKVNIKAVQVESTMM